MVANVWPIIDLKHDANQHLYFIGGDANPLYFKDKIREERYAIRRHCWLVSRPLSSNTKGIHSLVLPVVFVL